jgi:hypothetical protein
VRIRVRNVESYLGIVTERVFHHKTVTVSYNVYLMELETSILMFAHELEVLSEKGTST